MDAMDYYKQLLATPLAQRAFWIKDRIRGKISPSDMAVARVMGARIGLGRVPR